MNIGLIICGILMSVLTCILITNFKKLDILSRILSAVVFLLLIFSGYEYVVEKPILNLLIGVAFGLIFYFIWVKIFVKSKFYEMMIFEAESKIEALEEDFMNTKKGKIVTGIVAVLVVYAVISTVCILKLNSKINSMVAITNTLMEESNK